MNTGINAKGEKTAIYEVGFHLFPSISPEAVAGKFTAIKSVIEAHGGSFISEEMPKEIPLAYTIEGVQGGTKRKCNTAYFGWIKYEAPVASAPAIKAGIEKNDAILRSLIIKTVRENTMTTPPNKFNRKQVEESTGEKVSAEELDKTIEKIATE